ncbi:MAG: endonuclease domain-containing protein [Methylococcales bacterium]
MNLKNARELRKNATDCERLLWQHLRAHRLQGFKFKRQQPLGIYIVDFVCFETRLIVEADGGHHAEQTDYDTRRDDWLRGQGFSVLRFWNNDILNNTEGVLELIVEVCEKNSPPLPNPSPVGEGLTSGKAT